MKTKERNQKSSKLLEASSTLSSSSSSSNVRSNINNVKIRERFMKKREYFKELSRTKRLNYFLYMCPTMSFYSRIHTNNKRCSAYNPNVDSKRTSKSRCIHNCSRFAIPYCDYHLNKILGIEIKKSTIHGAGYGLFTTRDIPNQAGTFDYIIHYDGEILDDDMLTKRYGNHAKSIAPYAIEHGDVSNDSDSSKNHLYVDSALFRYPGSYANHSDDPLKQNVCFLYIENESNQAAAVSSAVSSSSSNGLNKQQVSGKTVIQSTRDILAGEELFVDYGDYSSSYLMCCGENSDIFFETIFYEDLL